MNRNPHHPSLVYNCQKLKKEKVSKVKPHAISMSGPKLADIHKNFKVEARGIENVSMPFQRIRNIATTRKKLQKRT